MREAATPPSGARLPKKRRNRSHAFLFLFARRERRVLRRRGAAFGVYSVLMFTTEPSMRFASSTN